MPKSNKCLYKAAPFHLVRVSTFPINEFFKLKEEGFEETLLKLFKEDSNLRETILVGSPSLYQTLTNFNLRNGTSEKQKAKAFSALFKYILRMSTRATLFWVIFHNIIW